MSSGRLSFSFFCFLRSGVVLLGIVDCLAYIISECLCGGLLLFYRLAFVFGIKGLMDLYIYLDQWVAYPLPSIRRVAII